MLALAAQLVPQLLVGDHPAIAALRAQYERARVVSVELTGHGLFINYEVPGDAPLAFPADFAGGDAHIKVAGHGAPSGCVLFVRRGRLDMLEVHTYGDAWTEHAQVLAVEDVFSASAAHHKEFVALYRAVFLLVLADAWV